MKEENKTPEPTPEQLLKMLDIQMAASRQRREMGAVRSGSGRIVALCAIIFGAAISLWVLMYLLEEMRPVKDSPDGPPSVERVEPSAVTPPVGLPAPGANPGPPAAPAGQPQPAPERPVEGSR